MKLRPFWFIVHAFSQKLFGKRLKLQETLCTICRSGVHSRGHHDGHQPVQPSGQTRGVRKYLAPGVAFFNDVGFIIHTTKVVLLKVKLPDFIHFDSNTGGSDAIVHSSRCYLSTRLSLGQSLDLYHRFDEEKIW